MNSKSDTFVKSTGQNSKNGGLPASGSDMTALHALKHVTCSTPRRLNASEIKLLRLAKQEISKLAGKCLQES